MGLYRPKGSKIWWCSVQIDGQRIRKSTGASDKNKALIFYNKLQNELWKVQKLGDQPPLFFEEACKILLQISQDQQDFSKKQTHVEYFLQFFAGRRFDSITPEELMSILPEHIQKSTMNRYISTFCRMQSLCFKQGRLDKKIHVEKFKEKKINFRFLTQNEFTIFHQNLSLNWVKDACLFAVATGMRSNEIFSLRWRDVNWDNKFCIVSADLAKSRVARNVPLNDDAYYLLQKRHKTKKSEYCFVRDRGNIKIGQIDKRCIIRSIEKTGLDYFTFHDLRHTWASWHVQSGTPLMVLKELGGWETLDMVMKYAHLGPNHLSEYANQTLLGEKFMS